MDTERVALWGFLISFAVLSQFIAGWLLKCTRTHDPQSQVRCTAYMCLMAFLIYASWVIYGGVVRDIPLLIGGILWGGVTAYELFQLARLLIAGTGTYEPELRRMAGGSDRVTFLGHLSSHQLRSLYRQAVAVIMPSLCFEVLPLVPLEALSQETPVIVRNLGGMPEIVDQSGGGFVYDTEEELPGLLDQLLDDPERRRKLGRKGYEAYQRDWTAEVHVQRYLALIAELATKKGVPA